MSEDETRKAYALRNQCVPMPSSPQEREPMIDGLKRAGMMTDPDTPSPQEHAAGKGCYLSTLELHELDEACAPFVAAFGHPPYLVGSVNERPDFRDVDVRLILPDDEYDALFQAHKGLWALLSRLSSSHLKAKTGLPVDFQVQRMTEANEKYGRGSGRNPLGSRSLLDFAGGGDATAGALEERSPDAA